MKPINELTKDILKEVKLIVFDVDGVLVPRGTKIKQENDVTTFHTRHIDPKQIDQIKKLKELGFYKISIPEEASICCRTCLEAYYHSAV